MAFWKECHFFQFLLLFHKFENHEFQELAAVSFLLSPQIRFCLLAPELQNILDQFLKDYMKMWVLHSMQGWKFMFIYALIQQAWPLTRYAELSVVSLKSFPSTSKVLQRRSWEPLLYVVPSQSLPKRATHVQFRRWGEKRPLHSRGSLGCCVNRWQTWRLAEAFGQLL